MDVNFWIKIMRPLKVVFMGSPEFSVPILSEILISGHKVICVYCQPPRPSGRGKKIIQCPVHKFASSKSLHIKTPNNFRDSKELGDFQKLGADIAVVAAYGLLLPIEILSAPKFGCINLHASLLPRWRGAAPIQRAIEAGDKVTGVCIIQMTERLDEGPIICEEKLLIGENSSSISLHHELSNISARLIGPALKNISTGNYRLSPQANKGAIYARKLSKHEGRLVWSDPAEAIERKIRAFSPWPGAWFEFKGEQIKILSGLVYNNHVDQGVPFGTVVDDLLTVMCGSGTFRPNTLQRPSKRPMEVKEFLRGYNIGRGCRLG